MVAQKLTGNTKPTKKALSKIARKKERLKRQLWPDLDSSRLWDRQKSAGWLSVPRAMPLILRIVDMLSEKGKPVSSTYLDLWCRTFDDSFIIVTNPHEMAYYAGFTGERAQSTWATRMRILERLEFIATKEGSIPMNYVLLFNPYQVIKRHREEGSVGDVAYTLLLQRMLDIGADDLDDAGDASPSG
jgi:hypothetical protein